MRLYLHSSTHLCIRIPGCSQNKVKRGATKGQSLRGTKTSKPMCGLTVLVPARVHRPAHRCTALHSTTGGRTSQVQEEQGFTGTTMNSTIPNTSLATHPNVQAQRPTASTEYSRQHPLCDCHCVTPRAMLSTAGFSLSAPRQVMCLTAPPLSV